MERRQHGDPVPGERQSVDVRLLDQLMDVGSRPGETLLWREVRSAARGGKKIRPQVLLATYDALTCEEPQAGRRVAERVAAAIELLHTAFLAHDDVIDGDLTRRGRPNVSGRYAEAARAAGASPQRAAGYGAAAGVLGGDLALAGAFRLVATTGADPAVTIRLLELFDETLHVTADGELSDVWLSLGITGMLEDVLRTAERKTAVYTFSLPLRAGAVLAGRSDLDAPLRRLGRSLGLAFQLRDDVDGTFGDPQRTGKSTSSDLREGKLTALVALARDTEAWAEIAPVLGADDATGQDHERVRDLLEDCGARAGVERLAAAHEADAAAVAAELGLDLDALAPSLPFVRQDDPQSDRQAA